MLYGIRPHLPVLDHIPHFVRDNGLTFSGLQLGKVNIFKRHEVANRARYRKNDYGEGDIENVLAHQSGKGVNEKVHTVSPAISPRLI
ncbi:hypothetical protein, partial [Enterococcus faecalis]|uniref:hypothetical protein n=1 Tax=Enterococcus faecalis TaxID=1351 RepID=UPI00403FAC25